MSDNAPTGSSRKKTLGILPPPPRMTASSASTTTGTSTSQQRPTPQAHSIFQNIPKLESAPTSGNFDDFASAATQAASEQLQAAMGMLGAQFPPSPRTTNVPVESIQTSPKSSHTLPPPPTRTLPPPPPPTSGGLHPTIAPLPPPPIPNAARSLPRPPPPPPPPPPFPVTTKSVPPQQAIPPPKTGPPQPSTSNDPVPPPFLPQMQFRSKKLHVTASRQEHLTVLVVASESAHRMAWKNGLRLSDLLGGLYRSATSSSTPPTPPLAPFRSVTRSLTISWPEVRVRFVEEEQLSPVSDETAADSLQRAAALQEQDGNLPQELALLEDQIDNLLGSNTPTDQFPDGPAAMAARRERHAQVVEDAFQLTSPLNIPWLVRYRLAADDCTDHLEHEQFACPAVILAVCTTAETSPVIETLRSLHHLLPVHFRNGQFDPQSARHEVLVLHDALHGHKGLDEEALRNHLVSAFGPASQVVRMNSLAPETAAVLADEEESDLWGGGGKLGSCLTVSDRARMRKFLTQMVATAVLPSMERRIADLNAIVSDRKKGVKNVLKSFWGGRKKEEEEGAPAAVTKGDVQYRFDSIETQVRLLADSLFLMKDYEAAYSMYRLIKDDFKQDKSWIHYASVHEMMALSLYMFDPFGRSKEVFASVETALLSYSRAFEDAPQWGEKPGRTKEAPAATRLGTRLCLVLVSTRNVCSGRNLEVADLLAAASSNETSLGAAVLLEQSAANYFKAELYRKYSFHMLMSGHMFRGAQHEHHAFRCFASALHIYRNEHWDDLHNHVLSALAMQLFSMSRMAISLQLFAKLVGSLNGSRVSVTAQQKYIKNLLDICKDHAKKALVGADRMASPPNLIGAARDAFRKDRIDRIVQVVRFTKSATRILELPNMKLPLINDSSVRVFTSEESAHYGYQNLSGFGETHSGSPEVWEDLMISMISELKAESNEPGEEIIVGKTLAKVEDPAIRKVIALVEKEKNRRNLEEKAKRLGKSVESAPIRALEEPITVEFELRNPLSIEIEVSDIQLVAKMSSAETGQVCTNEDAIQIRPLAETRDKREWTFQNSKVVFEVSDFCRLSAEKSSQKDCWRSAEDNDPFFVVTKQSLKLAPDSVQTIATSICPLLPGQLEIVGVRSRLLDSVWVYHPFDIKGPLLQNTRSNRVNRVRGESFLLKSSVQKAMPSLAVDLVPCNSETADGDSPVIDSEHRKWRLHVSNSGTAPASNLTLKLSEPWIRILSPGSDAWDQSRPVSSTIGPTGTLMSVPLSGPGVKEVNTIYPGETALVDIDLRPFRPGKQDFYMLFRYELAGASPITAADHRWLKKMFTVPIYPSLNITASLSPSFSESGDFMLFVEVDNLRTDRPDKLDLTLDNVALISRNYNITSVPGLEMTSKKLFTVGWQEKSSYQFRVQPSFARTSELMSTQCCQSAAESSREVQEAIDGSSAPAAFVCLEHAHGSYTDAVAMHHRALARAINSQGEEGAPRSISSIRRSNAGDGESTVDPVPTDDVPPTSGRTWPFEEKEKVQLVCSWTDPASSIKGFHILRDIAVCTDTEANNIPIVVTAKYPSTVVNDFGVGPASIPVEVTLRNNRRYDPVQFEFSLQLSERFGFVGPEKYTAELDGGEECSIHLQAVLPSAGVYDLQRVQVMVGSNYNTPSPVRQQWIVTARAFMHEV